MKHVNLPGISAIPVVLFIFALICSTAFSSGYVDVPVYGDVFKDTVGITFCPGYHFNPWDNQVEIGGRLIYQHAWIDGLDLFRIGGGIEIGMDLGRAMIPWLVLRPSLFCGFEWSVRTDREGLIDGQPGAFFLPSLDAGIRWSSWLETSVTGNMKYSLNAVYQVFTIGAGLKIAVHLESEPTNDLVSVRKDEDGTAEQTEEMSDLTGEMREIVGTNSNMELTTSKKEIKIKMADIIFSTGSSVIRPQFSGILFSMGKAIASYPNMKVLLEGHTDDIGEMEYNIRLSRKRAESVSEYFIRAGIAESRIETFGYGPNRPIVSNTGEANRQKNRRVEIRISWIEEGGK